MDSNKQQATALRDVVKVIYLDEECEAGNAEFYKNNNFIALKTRLENPESESGERMEKTYERVFLHRAFPFDNPMNYISVLDKEMAEIGLIKDMQKFSSETLALLESELDRKYYAPKINMIKSIKESYGFSYWKVNSTAGPLQFTLQDTYRSILRVTSTRVFIIDMSGNRYEIPDVEALDRKSYRRIELYL